MDFFGIGPLEIILILILGLLVFGPGKLPQIGKDLGKTFRSFKKAATDISAQVSKELEEEKAAQEPAPKETEQKIAQADTVSKPEAGDQAG
jgi:sec-independent protein translocase protein TatA